MKIGAFANINDLSIDSIRHYMDIGLIIPEKKGGQYSFDDRCQTDLNDIIALKDMGFTLNEISNIFTFKRMGKLIPYQQDDYYRGFFVSKYEAIKKEINALEGFKQNLEIKLEELLNHNLTQQHRIGIPLRVLDILSCHQCKGNLILTNGSIVDSQIIDGTLRCNCGQQYIIESGILSSQGTLIGKDFDFNQEYTNYIVDYINTTNTKFLDNINKGLEWKHKALDFQTLKGKVLLELGTGLGFFLRYIYNDLPEDCVYLAVDRDNARNLFLKSILEKTGCRKNIVFICSDFLQIPIKDKSIHVLIDQSGTSNYSFGNSDFLLKLIDNYVGDNAELLGSYIIFEKFSRNSLIEKSSRPNFTLDSIKEHIARLGYIMLQEKASEYIEKSSKYENYFVDGEKVYAYLYYGKR